MGSLTVSGDVASFKSVASVPLSECKCSFSPVQSGSGDPSPSNIRPITGWTGLEVHHSSTSSEVINLPSDYQQVDYIQSDGYAYIDTGVYGNQDSGVLYDIQLCNIGDYHIFGSRTSASSNAFYITIRGGTWFASSYDGSGNQDFTLNGVATGTKVVADLNRHTFIIQKRVRYFDGIEQDPIGTYSEFTTPSTLTLFRLSQDTVVQKRIEMRIYRCIIYNNEVPVRNFIPCYRKQDNVIGMYDLISETFYTNSGNGSFSIGPKVYGQNISVSWSSEGTVYGGSVDLVTGKVISTYQYISLKDLSPVTYGSSSYDGIYGTNVMWYITKTGLSSNNNINCYSDKFKNVSAGIWGHPDDHIWEYVINSQNQLHTVFDNATVGITQDMSFAEKRNTVSSWLQNNNAIFVLPLETPVTYQLDPITLKALRGQNHVWNNAGTTEITYPVVESKEMTQIRRTILLNEPHIETTTGSIASFNTNATLSLKKAQFGFTPVQEGTGDPSPSNVRTITGWDGLDVSLCSTNLFDGEMENGDISETTGQNNGTSSSRYRCKNYVPYNIEMGGFYFHSPGRTGNFRIFSYDANKNFIGYGSYTLNSVITFSTNDNTKRIKYIRFRFGSSAINDDVQISINIPNTVNTYIPYKGQTISVSWSSSGTIYGGYVDLITGELAQTWQTALLNDPDKWSTYQTYRHIYDETFDAYLYNSEHAVFSLLCSIVPTDITTDSTARWRGSSNLKPCIMSETITLEQIKQNAEAGNIQIAYMLKNPIIYPLTPTQLKSFRGTNNLWSNGNGNATVQYWKF